MKSWDRKNIRGKIVIDDSSEVVKDFLIKESKKKRSYAPKLVSNVDVARSVRDICVKLYPSIYPVDNEVMYLKAKPAWDESIFITHELSARKGCIWYSAEGLDLNEGDLPYRFNGRYDPISEILMAPCVYSIHDAEEEFVRILVRPTLTENNPITRYTELLARLAFRDMCFRLAEEGCTDVYPVLVLTDNLIDMASVLDDGVNADGSVAFRFEDEGFPPRLLPNLAETRDAIRLGAKDALISVSRFISKTRSAFSHAGVCSFWADNMAYILINTDRMSVPEIRAAFELIQLYNCTDHKMALPGSWKNEEAAEWLASAEAVVSCGVSVLTGESPIVIEPCPFPTVDLHNIRVKLISSVPDLMEEHDMIPQLKLLEPDPETAPGEYIKFSLLGEKPNAAGSEYASITFDNDVMSNTEMDAFSNFLLEEPEKDEEDEEK